MSCLCAYTDPGSVYPVIDPLRTSSQIPQVYGYGFAWDWVRITVDDDATLGPGACRMRVVLVSRVTNDKSIAAWNYCTNSIVDSVATIGRDKGPHEMIVERGNCHAGAHTLLLRKAMAFSVMTGLYTLASGDLWTYWGGKKVTFAWMGEDGGSGVWGADTPTPTYPVKRGPIVAQLPDDGGTWFFGVVNGSVVYFRLVGGALFQCDATEATALGLETADAPFESGPVVGRFPKAPVDFTLLRERSNPDIYIVFGGAKFKVPATAP
jgi:hypothetical protein